MVFKDENYVLLTPTLPLKYLRTQLHFTQSTHSQMLTKRSDLGELTVLMTTSQAPYQALTMQTADKHKRQGIGLHGACNPVGEAHKITQTNVQVKRQCIVY